MTDKKPPAATLQQQQPDAEKVSRFRWLILNGEQLSLGIVVSGVVLAVSGRSWGWYLTTAATVFWIGYAAGKASRK